MILKTSKIVTKMNHSIISKTTRLLLVVGLFLVSPAVFGQNDPKAEAIIKKVAAVYQSYTTIKAAFTLTTTPVSGRASVEKGSVWLKGKKFRLDYASQEIYCNSVYMDL